MAYKRTLGILKTCGIQKAEVQFSGCGDEGGVDAIMVTIDGIEYELCDPPHAQLRTALATAKLMLESLYELLEKPVDDRFGGFDGNGVSGTITFDVAAGTITLDHAVEEYVEQPTEDLATQ